MIEIEFHDGITNIRFPKQVLVAQSHGIRETMLALVEKGFRNLVISFANVEILDSAGLGLLISVEKALDLKNGVMKVIEVPHKIMAIMKIMSLHKHFEITTRG